MALKRGKGEQVKEVSRLLAAYRKGDETACVTVDVLANRLRMPSLPDWRETASTEAPRCAALPGSCAAVRLLGVTGVCPGQPVGSRRGFPIDLG